MKEMWYIIDVTKCQIPTQSMPSRVEAVLSARGDPSDY